MGALCFLTLLFLKAWCRYLSWPLQADRASLCGLHGASHLCGPLLQSKAHKENHEILCGFSVFSSFRLKSQVAARFLYLGKGITRTIEAERFLTLNNDIIYYVFMWCYFVVLYLLQVLALHDMYEYS